MKGQKNLTLVVYGRIKEMMLDYDIVPGQRLVFVDLAQRLGVSRTPVNNALSILAKEGYLDFVPNQGYSVHKLTEKEAEDLYDVREILELGTIGRAIRQMTPQGLELFSKRKNDFEKTSTDRVQRKMFILDTEFHAAIIEMTGNEYLPERYREICRKIFLRFRIEHLRVERIGEIIKEHEQLFEAVRYKDVDRCKRLIKEHYQNSRKNLFSIIFKHENEARLKASA